MKRILYLLPLVSAAFMAGAGETSPLQVLEARASEGDSAAMYQLSYLLETGRGGIPADSTRADSLLRASAERGYPEACNLLGYRYFGSDPDSMLMWIERAATAPVPSPKAFNNLGWLLSTGEGGVRRDVKKALYWYERGAAAGVPAAMTSLAGMLLDNPDVTPDSLRARELLTQAASKGFNPAGEKLYLLLRTETDTLSADSALALGIQYFDQGIYAVSAPMFMQAASADIPHAVALLGNSYAQGWGVPYDFSHAMHLFWHAALLGDPSARYIVGETLQQFPDAFADEHSCDPQQRTAEEWLENASAAGIPDARSAIRRLSPRDRK